MSREDEGDGGLLLLSEARESPFDSRRRSVDVGGLALALGASSRGGDQMEMGKGWGGWEESEQSGSEYAELLSDMYTQTQNAVNQPVLTPFPTVSASSRRNLIDTLDNWHFEPHKLPDNEVISCTLLVFEVLFRIEGMAEAVGVSLSQIGSFLLHLRQAYRATNSYHNFHHALDVFQATHLYLRYAGAVPPVSILHIPESDPRSRWRAHDELRNTWIGLLRLEDIFALFIAAIGHDVGHPGFNNIFMKNAQAPLSQVFDHKSALEQMHCAFLLPIMKHHGFGGLLAPSRSGGQSNFRRLLLDTVLATDMGVHKDFMDRFAHLMEDPQNFNVSEARTLLCQALIKCADISNPSRPHTVSQHWSAALAAEWASQALLERQLCLPVSVQDSDDPITEAKGQISFITFCCSPLLEVTSMAIPEMRAFAEQCSTNCSLWKARLAELEKNESSKGQNYPPDPYRSLSSPQPQDYHTVFPLSLPAHFYHPLSAASSIVDTESLVGNDVRTEMDYMDAEPSPAAQTGYATGREDYVEPMPSSSRSPSPTFVMNRPREVDPAFTFQQHAYPSVSSNDIGISPYDASPATESASENTSPRSEFTPPTPGAFSNGPLHPAISHRHASTASMHSNAASLASLSTVGTGWTSMSTFGSGNADRENSDIRAAYKLSVRKKKSFHRNSWTPELTDSIRPHQKLTPYQTTPISVAFSNATMRTLFTQRPDLNPTSSTSTSSSPANPGPPPEFLIPRAASSANKSGNCHSSVNANGS